MQMDRISISANHTNKAVSAQSSRLAFIGSNKAYSPKFKQGENADVAVLTDDKAAAKQNKRKKFWFQLVVGTAAMALLAYLTRKWPRSGEIDPNQEAAVVTTLMI